MKNFWIILILGIIIRVLLSYATMHSDLQAMILGGREVAQGHILNLYDYSFPANILNYPPLIYWYFGLLNLFFGSIYWLFKLPYLIFDLSVGVLLFKLFDSKKALLAFGLWIFNPINLYATYMVGQFDIIPTSFTVLSVYLIYKKRLNWAAIALGIGIAFKLYPIFLVIPFILLADRISTRVKLVILTALPYIISVFPYLSSRSFRSLALFANQSSKSLYANIPVSGGESILLFPAFLLFFYLLIWGIRNKVEIWKLFLVPLLLFFIFTHYHPQWLIWITPFLIINLVTEKYKNIIPVLVITASWLGSLFFFESSLTLGLFTPVFPALKNTADIWTIANLYPNFNVARSLLQTILTATSFYLVYDYIFKKDA